MKNIVTRDSDIKSGVKLYKRLVFYIKPYWLALVISFLANIIFAGVDSYSTFLFKPILDKGFASQDIHFLKMLPMIILGLFILRGIASFVSTYMLGWIGANVVRRFRKNLFEKFLSAPKVFFDENQMGKLLSKFTFNVEQITNATGQALTTIVRQSFLVLGLLIVMLYISWKLTLIVFIVVPVIGVLVAYVTKRFRKIAKRIQDSMGDLNHLTEESILGNTEIKIFAATHYQNKHFLDVLNYNFKQTLKMTLTLAANTPVIQLIAAFAMSLIVYIMFHHGLIISAGSFVSFLAAMIAILKPVKQLTQVNAEIQRGISAAESVFEVIDTPSEIDLGDHILKSCSGKITFRNAGFQYADGTPILRQINLSIEPGQTVAFVGKSGAGKSTLMNILPRFYNLTEGQILIEGIDAQTIDLKNLRSFISIVSQHVVLFDDSVYNNIAFGDLNTATEKSIIKAAKLANAWDFIKNLPLGLHTRVGPNGMALSGGQRQRIAIARAILKNAPILILDEATSSLDNTSERAIQKALENLMKNCTTLVVAHRLSTIEQADLIVVLDKGEIIEQGSHSVLMKRNKAYASLQKESFT